MSKRLEAIHRLENAIRAYERTAAAQERNAERYPQIRELALRAAERFRGVAEAKRFRLRRLLIAGVAGADAPRVSTVGSCYRCGRRRRRGLVLMDRLADGTERWRCRNQRGCSPGAA